MAELVTRVMMSPLIHEVSSALADGRRVELIVEAFGDDGAQQVRSIGNASGGWVRIEWAAAVPFIDIVPLDEIRLVRVYSRDGE